MTIGSDRYFEGGTGHGLHLQSGQYQLSLSVQPGSPPGGTWTEGHEPARATEENAQTWWQAASDRPGEWLCVDLGQHMDVHAVQINFADDKIDIPIPGKVAGGLQARYIEERDQVTRWKLEASADGETCRRQGTVLCLLAKNGEHSRIKRNRDGSLSPRRDRDGDDSGKRSQDDAG